MARPSGGSGGVRHHVSASRRAGSPTTRPVGQRKIVDQPALNARVALVTGAGKRIGRAIALALAKDGYRIAVHFSASAAGARETVRMIAADGGQSCVFRADLRRLGEPARLVADVARTYGRLDVLVNSAASMTRTPLRSVRETDWDEVFALNLRAPFFAESSI